MAAVGNETELFGNDHALVAPLALVGLCVAIATGFAAVLQLADGLRGVARRFLGAALLALPLWFALTYAIAHV